MILPNERGTIATATEQSCPAEIPVGKFKSRQKPRNIESAIVWQDVDIINGCLHLKWINSESDVPIKARSNETIVRILFFLFIYFFFSEQSEIPLR